MAKIRNDYFELTKNQLKCCLEAANLLEEILGGFSAVNISEQKQRMHDIENRADELHHDIHTRLASEFITPIDQEDILHLVQIVDDITDAIDEVVLCFYMYALEEAPAFANDMAKTVKRCVEALYEAVLELKNFKKAEKLRQMLVKVNSIEGEADGIYVEAIHQLFATCDDTKKLIGFNAIYERLESCCDLCEHAADVIEQIIIKNT